MEQVKQGLILLIYSDLVQQELEQAPAEVQAVLNAVPKKYRQCITISDESTELAARYIKNGAIGKKSLVDAQHIAIATVARVDVLVSWNFKHIVNLDRIHAYNGVNLHHGYPILEIRSPLEVV